MSSSMGGRGGGAWYGWERILAASLGTFADPGSVYTDREKAQSLAIRQLRHEEALSLVTVGALRGVVTG